MAKTSRPLTALFVDGNPGSGKYYDLHGLVLIVRGGGSKYWEQRYTHKRRRRTVGIGPSPKVSLAAAREQALANLRLVRAGKDPIMEKHRDNVPTFAQASAIVHMHLKPSWSSLIHSKIWIRCLEIHAFPKIGNRLVTEITTEELVSLLEPVLKKKPPMGHRTRQGIQAVMQWVCVNGYRPDNPVGKRLTKLLPRIKHEKEHHPAVPHSQVAGVLDAVRNFKAWISHKLGLEFLVLTAARSGEVRGAVWDEISFELALWTIPAERMKNGEKHCVPLSSQALGILKRARELGEGTGLVFPSKRGFELRDMVFSKLLRDLGAQCVPHGMRSSFRDWCGETGIDRQLAEACLAHQLGDPVETSYLHTRLLDRRRPVMEAWGRYVSGDQA